VGRVSTLLTIIIVVFICLSIGTTLELLNATPQDYDDLDRHD
jgi:hypothetical protein